MCSAAFHILKIHPLTGHEVPEGVELQLCSFFNLGTRWGWVVNAMPRPFDTRETWYTLWFPGPVWTDAENLALHRDSIPGPSSL